MSTAAAKPTPPPPPPQIINLDDNNDDGVSVTYATSPAVSRRNRKTPINIGTTTHNPISVENYSYKKKTRTGRRPITNPITIDLSTTTTVVADDVVHITTTATTTKEHSSGGTHPNSEDHEISLTFTCEICVELTPYAAAFFIMGGCTHSYCSNCIISYVAAKLQDNITQIRCPERQCPGLIEHDDCRHLLPKEVFDRWGDALCEAALLASEKYFCPFKDCSAPLLVEGGDDHRTVTESECPNCSRLFCVKCKVPWHAGIKCEEFQKLNKDEREKEDIMLMQLAKNKKWIRCPKCRVYVEKSDGCIFMRCRCGHTFCYICGAPLTNHYCTNCKRTW